MIHEEHWIAVYDSARAVRVEFFRLLHTWTVRVLVPCRFWKAAALYKVADPERAPLVRRAFEEDATGRYTKEHLLEQARAWGLTNRRGRPLPSTAWRTG
jgi:hypothetical protein